MKSVLRSPELTTQWSIPIVYDWTKDKLDDISDTKQWEDVLKEMKGFVGLQTDTLGRLSDTTSAVTSNILYTNFETKVEAIEDISEEQKTAYKKRVAEAIENTVFPAYLSLIDYFEK